MDGRIVVVHKGEIREVTRLGQNPCGKYILISISRSYNK